MTSGTDPAEEGSEEPRNALLRVASQAPWDIVAKLLRINQNAYRTLTPKLYEKVTLTRDNMRGFFVRLDLPKLSPPTGRTKSERKALALKEVKELRWEGRHGGYEEVYEAMRLAKYQFDRTSRTSAKGAPKSRYPTRQALSFPLMPNVQRTVIPLITLDQWPWRKQEPASLQRVIEILTPRQGTLEVDLDLGNGQIIPCIYVGWHRLSQVMRALEPGTLVWRNLSMGPLFEMSNFRSCHIFFLSTSSRHIVFHFPRTFAPRRTHGATCGGCGRCRVPAVSDQSEHPMTLGKFLDRLFSVLADLGAPKSQAEHPALETVSLIDPFILWRESIALRDRRLLDLRPECEFAAAAESEELGLAGLTSEPQSTEELYAPIETIRHLASDNHAAEVKRRALLDELGELFITEATRMRGASQRVPQWVLDRLRLIH